MIISLIFRNRIRKLGPIFVSRDPTEVTYKRMSNYDYERPYISENAMQAYVTTDKVVAQRYGRTVKATSLANIEYKIRFDRLQRENNMKPPPSCGRIFSGYLVVRKLNTPEQYETWMPDEVFEEIYQTIQS